jgi:hypothetical protein
MGKQKSGICAYCGEYRKIDMDHVPPMQSNPSRCFLTKLSVAGKGVRAESARTANRQNTYRLPRLGSGVGAGLRRLAQDKDHRADEGNS